MSLLLSNHSWSHPTTMVSGCTIQTVAQMGKKYGWTVYITSESSVSNPINTIGCAPMSPLLLFPQSPGGWQWCLFPSLLEPLLFVPFAWHCHISTYFKLLFHVHMAYLPWDQKLCRFGNHSPDLPQLRAHNRCLIAYLSIDYLSKLHLKNGIYHIILSFYTIMYQSFKFLIYTI